MNGTRVSFLIRLMVLVFAGYTSAQPEIDWTQEYSTRGYAGITTDLVVQNEEGFLIAGTCYNYQQPGGLLLIQTDENGEEIQRRGIMLEDSTTEKCKAFIRCNDGGYAIAGYCGNANNYDALLVKITADCQVDWSKTYNFDNRDQIYAMLQLPSSRFVLAGGAGFETLVTDSAGNLLWRQFNFQNQPAFCKSMCLTRDGSIVQAGYWQHDAGPRYTVPLVKINPGGGVIWSQDYDPFEDDLVVWAYSVEATEDSGFVVGGTATFVRNNMQADDAMAIRFRPSGDVMWSQTYQAADGWGHDSGKIIAVEDGGFLLGGALDIQGYCYRINPGGFLIWSSTFFPPQHNNPRSFNSITTCDDGGYAIVGMSIPGSYYGLLFKTAMDSANAVIEPPAGTSSDFVIMSPYPNPFNGDVRIDCRLNRGGDVRVEVFDLHGRSISELNNGYLPQGEHKLLWKTTGQASGAYIVRLSLEGGSIERTVNLLK